MLLSSTAMLSNSAHLALGSIEVDEKQRKQDSVRLEHSGNRP